MPAETDLADAVERARAFVASGRRNVLGITGPPGAGKSTISAALVAALPAGSAVVVPMDGYHLAQAELERLGRADRKGAPDTFDAAGFVALLARIGAAADGVVVYAPLFRREIEEPIAGAIAVSREVPLVVVEGNYLLVEEPPWDEVASLLDETWYVDPGPLRREWLVTRHMAFGRDRAEAEERSDGSDHVNALLVEGTRHRADVVVTGA